MVHVQHGEIVNRGLTLPEELVLTLLNEENGYFHQVHGWTLNCALAGSVLAELSLLGRLDTDMESVILLDDTETGDPVLDTALARIVAEPGRHNARYWVERLAVRSDSVVHETLDRLVERNVLEHHEGEFWTLVRTGWQAEVHAGDREGSAAEYVKTRISRVIFNDDIPDPRDIIIICLANACDVLRFMFQLEEEAAERVEFICKMDLIGRAIADAVSQSLVGPLLQRGALSREIPVVPRWRLLRNPHVRDGNIPAFFARLYDDYGPVYEVRLPFVEPMTILAGPRANQWAHRQGRIFLRASDYLQGFEKVYGGVGILPALDGADHFKYRKTIGPGYSRARLEARLSECFGHAQRHMAAWSVGDSYPAVRMCRRLMNESMSPLFISVDSQDIVDDLHKFKERVLSVYIAGIMPKFLMKTPGMRRRAKLIDVVVSRVESGHTPAQRAGCPRDLADELLSMHASDPQFLPESNLRFVLSAALIASMYVGDQLGLIVHAMVARPELYEKIRAEADAVFADGEPDTELLTGPGTDVTRRFVMECMRVYPIAPMAIRNVMNTCMLEGYELREGTRVHIVQTATHYMSEVFPDPYSFDIDRYLPERKEHIGTGYAPYGLGTHSCLGSRWTEMLLTIHVLLMAHHFRFEIAPKNYKFRISPVPSMRVSKKLKFAIAERRHEVPG